MSVAEDIRSKFKIYFTNFSKKIPQNLKFYYNNQQINLEEFAITDIKEEAKEVYTIKWEWTYEGGDIQDTLDSLIGDISFNIVLIYENEEVLKILPRSGDILTNY